MSTELIDAPAPSSKDAAFLARRELIQASARNTVKRRRISALVIRVLFGIAVVLVLIPLVALVFYVCKRGIGALSVAFFTQTPTPPGIPGGGISNSIVGTLIICGLAVLIAIPIGLLVALLLIERTGPIPSAIRFGADVLSGLPSILIGLFAFSVIVAHTHYSGWAASVALAVLMLPIMIRGDEEAMRTVPGDLWEAGLALGARQSRVVRSVVVRGSIPGLITANLLGSRPRRGRDGAAALHHHLHHDVHPEPEGADERHPLRHLLRRHLGLQEPAGGRLGRGLRPHGRRPRPQHHRPHHRRPPDQEISLMCSIHQGEGNV